jgi:hypothetical protein
LVGDGYFDWSGGVWGCGRGDVGVGVDGERGGGHPPKVTDVVPVSSVPVMVTVVPPVTDPTGGVIVVIFGGVQ